MNVLVTGASGLVGGHLCQRLRQEGFAVRMAVRSRNARLSPDTQVVTGDIDQNTDWGESLAGVQLVFHLAARVHVMNDQAQDPLTEFRRVNTLGTLNLAHQAAKAGVKRFVFISSVKVNGESTRWGSPFTESDPPKPQDAYGQSKSEAELGLRVIAAQTGMEVCIVRPPLVYGPGVKANFAALIRAVQKGWPMPLGAIHNARSMVALDNLVDFLLTCATHPEAADQTFLISDGHDLSSSELMRGLARAAAKPSRLFPVPMWVLQWAGCMFGKQAQINRLCGNLQVDSAKARRLLSWTPPVSVEEGLRRTVQGLKP